MEPVLTTSVWLLAIAIVAFVAVGCGPPGPTSVPVADTPASNAAPTSDTTPPPTVVVVQADRAPAALLAITPQPAPQSGQVQVGGRGFAAGESVRIVASKTGDASSEPLQLATATAGGDGRFDPVTITLSDQLQSGAHPLRAVGQTSGREAAATLWIRAPQPWLVLDSYDVPQYGDFGFAAGGFEPMDQVVASLEPAAGSPGSPVRLVTLTTDQAGNAAWTQLKLPALAAGSYTLVLHGQANLAELRREVHVTPLKPTIELSPWAGPPGIPVQVNARGFAPNEHVHVSVGSAPDPTALQADEYGNLWGAGPVRIPQTASPGSLDLNLVGDESGATSTAEFKVLEPKPWLELTSWSGAPGAPVGFGGGGWIGGERVDIHIGSATSPIETIGTADDNGWLKSTGQAYVPLDTGDDVIFVAVGEQSHLVAAATFKVVFPFGLRPGQQPQAPRANGGGG
jgi:hypothetical protein